MKGWDYWYKYVENEMKNRNPAHDFEHIRRVLRYARMLYEKEGGDWEVIKWAALFHDIVREDIHEIEGDHAKLGADLTRKLLKDELDEDTLNWVCRAIASHSRRSGVSPESPEDKILYDADKLDGVGCIGILRWVIVQSNLGHTLVESLTKYRRILEDAMKHPETAKVRFYTETARKIVEDRYGDIEMCLDKVSNETKAFKNWEI